MLRSGLILLAAVVLLAGICGDETTPAPTSAPATIPADLTLEEVYERMESAIQRDGQVLHTRVVIEDVTYKLPPGEEIPNPPGDFDFKEYMERYADQLWIFPEADVARIETVRMSAEGSDDEKSVRFVHEKTVARDETGRPTPDPLTCRGTTSALLTQLMRCGNYLEESTTAIEVGEYDGRPAIVLFSEGELPSHDWTAHFTSHLYVDPSSYLPIASNIWEDAPFETTFKTRYEHEFVDRDSLPDAFFVDEPAADPAAKLVPNVDGMRVYWLGRLVPASGGLPQLTLMLSGVRSPDSRYGQELYRAELDYESDIRGKPVISLQEYTPDAWSGLSGSGVIPKGAGVTAEEIPVIGGHATLYWMPEEYGRYRAIVYFESTVIMIGDFHEYTPYASRDGFIALIQGLRPYEP